MSSFYQALSQPLTPAAWGGTGKGTHGADKTGKEPWGWKWLPHMVKRGERLPSGIRAPWSREGKAQNGTGEEQLLQRKVPGITNE